MIEFDRIRQHLATRNCWLEGAEELLEVLRGHFHELAESLGEDPSVKQSLCEPDHACSIRLQAADGRLQPHRARNLVISQQFADPPVSLPICQR